MKRTYLLILLVVFSCAFLGYKYATRQKPVSVIIQPASAGTVEATVSNTRAGSVKARLRARLAPAIGGQIATLPVRKGDGVKAGDILLTLWNRDLLAELELAQGQLTVAEASARENCRLADFAGRQAKRQTELKKSSSTSESIYEEAIVTAEAKKAACQAAQAQEAIARARIDATRAMIARTVLTAPFGGIVAEVNGEVGEYVTPSPPGIPTLPAVDLINMETLYVAAPIDEIDAAQIRPGMEARITLDAFPKKIFKGRVRSISPYVLEVAKQARTVEIEADFGDKGETARLLVGYSADVEVVLAARRDVVKVPTEAIIDGHYLYIVNPADKRIERREFSPGLGNWQSTEVVSGVSAGEQVVTTVDRAGLGAGVLVVVEPAAKEK